MSTRYDELRAEVKKFSAAHPEVWRLFSKFTFDRIGLGFKNYSANAIFERIRWETDQAQGTEFKLNNNYRPFYARAFMTQYPEHDGFFRTRKQISKAAPAVRRPPLGPKFFSDEARIT